jgi:hypothetical protein
MSGTKELLSIDWLLIMIEFTRALSDSTGIPRKTGTNLAKMLGGSFVKTVCSKEALHHAA